MGVVSASDCTVLWKQALVAISSDVSFPIKVDSI